MALSMIRKPQRMSSSPSPINASALLTSTRILLFALSAGVLVASLYYVQPLTSMLAASFGVGVTQAGYLVTATQIGYVLGIVFLVPLSDVLNRRKLLELDAGRQDRGAAAGRHQPEYRRVCDRQRTDGHYRQRPDGGHGDGGLVCARP